MSIELQPESERDYQQAVDVLYSTLNFEEKVLDRYQENKMDPDRPRRLLELLGDPHHAYPAIHIAGTKGKGSVAAMCAAVLRAAGLRVGLYTSPHLRDLRERIRVMTADDADGLISKDDFVALMDVMKGHFDAVPGVTWFEIMTAVAFRYFADQQVDIAVVEVGLGGRLDATNALTPLVSVITSLSLDHTYLLGDTLAQIASEKGGIIKVGVPVVSAPQSEEAMAVLQSIASDRETHLTLVGRDWQYQGGSRRLIITRSPDEAFMPVPTSFDLALAGDHQLENAAVALATLDKTRQQIPGITMTAVREGLATIKWDGRLQIVFEADNQPTLLVDSAHNKDSAAKLAVALAKDFSYRNLWFIFGAPEDKQISQMMALLFPMAKGAIVAAAAHPRAASPTQLVEKAEALGFEAIPAASVGLALTHAFDLAVAGDLICACGSIIFVGDLLNQWDSLKSQLIPN
jgi:dihydrofolate synthase/folylpolyglutamate synthase